MTTVTAGPVLRTVVNAMRRLYPEILADKSWDNTGLLLEAPPIRRSNTPKVLLTIDLTTPVVDEAIKLGTSVVVTYHPIIFRPLKSLTLSNTQQRSLLRLVQAGVSVYSPHTAVDAAVGGVNDWLADGISGGKENESERTVIESSSGQEGAGMGRIVTLREPTQVSVLVERVKGFLGLKHLQVALADKHRQSASRISTIGICAGSGGSLLRNVKADLLFTGELSHHEALSSVENGISVFACFHSNTERGYLSSVMKNKLEQVLPEEWMNMEGENEVETEIDGWEVIVSQVDKDPYEIA